jgi:hypothetical protein
VASRLGKSEFRGKVGVAATIPILGTFSTLNAAGSVGFVETASFRDTALVRVEGLGL